MEKTESAIFKTSAHILTKSCTNNNLVVIKNEILEMFLKL